MRLFKIMTALPWLVFVPILLGGGRILSKEQVLDFISSLSFPMFLMLNFVISPRVFTRGKLILEQRTTCAEDHHEQKITMARATGLLCGLLTIALKVVGCTRCKHMLIHGDAHADLW
jgi:hypothetical protein